VATIWHEYYTGFYQDPNSYYRTWDSARTREIFKERLETSLPGYQDMVFDVEHLPLSPMTDVVVSRRGLHLPSLGGDWAQDPLDVPPPNTQEMFEAISTGAAGNPVFTDTRRPPRK
jgi:hypothetical protein